MDLLAWPLLRLDNEKHDPAHGAIVLVRALVLGSLTWWRSCHRKPEADNSPAGRGARAGLALNHSMLCRVPRDCKKNVVGFFCSFFSNLCE